MHTNVEPQRRVRQRSTRGCFVALAGRSMRGWLGLVFVTTGAVASFAQLPPEARAPRIPVGPNVLDVLTPDRVLADYRMPLPSVQWVANSRQLILSLAERGPIGAEWKHWIEVVDLDSGKRSRVAEGENPRPSPDGLKIAYTGSEKGNAGLWIISVNGENPKPLTTAPGALGRASFTWSPDSRKIAYAVLTRPMLQSMSPTDPKSSSVVVIGRESETRNSSEIWVTDVETGSSRKLTSGSYVVRSLAWFPDGSALLCWFTDWFEDSFGEARSISIETGESLTLVKRPGGGTGTQSLYPVVSPEGKEVAFRYAPASARYAEYFNIGTISTKGGTIHALASDTYVDDASPPVWSPDGRRIYLTCKDGVFTQICAVASDGQARWFPRSLRNASGLAISPDGRRLAWTSQDAQGRVEIRVANSDGSKERVLLDLAPEVKKLALGDVQEVRWRSSDGLQIAGLLIKPVAYEGGKKYPLVVDVHAGPRSGVRLRGSILMASPLELHLWATKGFVVFVPDYRSSGIYDPDHISKARERQDRYERDFDDIMAGVDHVIKMGLVDESKLAVIGQSWGAVLTNWIITHTHRFKVAVSKEGLAEEYLAWANGPTTVAPRVNTTAEWFYQGTPWEVPQNYRKSSALEYVKGVQTPTLFVSGENGFPRYHNQFLYIAWRRQGVEAQYLVYKGEGHVIERPENQRDLLGRVFNWVDSHLQ